MKPLWTGLLTFGIIHIPVKVYRATGDRALRFSLLDRHGLCPASHLMVRKGKSAGIEYRRIEKGYTYNSGDHVVLADAGNEGDSLELRKSIEVLQFVEGSEIKNSLIERPYYIEPEPHAEKAYILLREALKRTGKTALGRFAFRSAQRAVMVRAEARALLLVTLKDSGNAPPLRLAGTRGTPERAKRDLDTTLQLVGALEEYFATAARHDEYVGAIGQAGEKLMGSDDTPNRGKRSIHPAVNMRVLVETFRKSLERGKKHMQLRGILV